MASDAPIPDGPLNGIYWPALSSYLESGVSHVEGWLSPTTASMIATMLVQQSRAGIRGDVCEIGVHHGKLFLILATATQAGECALAVDVFEDQRKNIDGSGHGSRAAFEANVARYAPEATVEIVQESSLDLPTLGVDGRALRFVSIDGGHTAAITANDLRLAERALQPGGLVALDDILSHAWTGVLSGLVTYLAEGGTLVPFALVPNKLMMTSDAAAALRWKQTLLRIFVMAVAKPELEFPGGSVASFNDHPYYSREGHAGLKGVIESLQRESATAREALDQARSMHAAQAAEAASHVETLRASMHVLRKELDRAVEMRAAAEREVASMVASRSWRLTEPLRMVGRRFKSTRRR